MEEENRQKLKNNERPSFFSSVKLKNINFGNHYLISKAIYLFLIPFLALIFSHLSILTVKDDLTNLFNSNIPIPTLILCSTCVSFALAFYFVSRPRKIYLVDFSCYKPEPARKVTREHYMQLCAASGWFTEESLGFKKKIMEKSGFGEMTYGPKGLMQIPTDMSMAEARNETEMVIFGAIDELLTKTRVHPRDIDMLVVNSSLFNPAPSLSAMVVNKYKLRGNIMSYNLGGMGCGAGLISIDLAKDLLQEHHNSYALVVSTENITRNWYIGNERPMLVTNILFRIGAAAILLSNRSADRRRSKYQLIHTVRTNKAADDKSYNCVFQQEDHKQIIGVSLSKELMVVAGQALKENITTLGPLVLPFSEQFLYLATLVAKKILKLKIKPYIPNFKLAFEHFCIHAGGRGVLDEVAKHLDLREWDMEPSKMTLYRFGNTSSSSLWYELAYSEAKGRIKKGDRVWQIGFGSGFKCNSCVWRAVRSIDPIKEVNPWIDEIDDFPVQIPKVVPIID